MKRAAERERGVVALLFVLIAFAVLCMAAAAIDLGHASLEQRRMQTAVESAALEGLSYRDVDPEGWRERVARRVQDHFRDWTSDEQGLEGFVHQDLEIVLEGGTPGSGALAALTLAEQQYPGDFARNDANALHGDVVRGDFFEDQGSGEDASYQRDDFEPLPLGDAVLVRMRRTTGDDPLDAQDGVSSHGRTVPFTFGMASGIHGDGTYDPRVDGITVRGTSIAQARPALAVDSAEVGEDRVLVIDHQAWAAWSREAGFPVVSLQVDGAGLVTDSGTPVGRITTAVNRVGQVVGSEPNLCAVCGQLEEAKVVLAAGVPTVPVSVVGFARSSLEFSCTPLGLTNGVTLEFLPSRVEPWASASLGAAVSLDETIAAMHASLGASAVLAPVLVR